jgi:hypothetical protein
MILPDPQFMGFQDAHDFLYSNRVIAKSGKSGHIRSFLHRKYPPIVQNSEAWLFKIGCC